MKPRYKGPEKGYKGKHPHRVIYYKDRLPIRQRFRTKAEADQKIKDLKEIFKAGGDVLDLQKASRAAGNTGYSVSALVTMALAQLKVNGAITVSPTVTFAEATKLVQDRAKTAGGRSATLTGYKYAYDMLNRTFGHRIATTITDAEVNAFLALIPNRQRVVGESTSNTKADYIRLIKTALRIIGITKPLPSIVEPEDPDKEIEFFNLDQVRLLFERARPTERGALALVLIAGLRPTLISELPAACVDVVGKKITIPKHLAKDRRRHVLEGTFQRSDGQLMPGLPDEIWPWLKAFPYNPVDWAPFQKRLRKSLNKFWIHDGTRHTAATYYNAIYGEEATSRLLTHESKTMALDHYIGITSREAAEAFYALNPASFAGVFQHPAMKKVIAWPPDKELEEWLAKEPAVQIAKKLGCSDVAIAKRCRKRGIAKPGLGAWVKRAFDAAVATSLGNAALNQGTESNA